MGRVVKMILVESEILPIIFLSILEQVIVSINQRYMQSDNFYSYFGFLFDISNLSTKNKDDNITMI